MSEILKITENQVQIGNDDGTIENIPLAALQFPNPKIGDQVRVYKDNDTVIVRLVAESKESVNGNYTRKINKVAYVLLTFFLGYLGVHRFMRGQVGLGILMFFFGWLTLGIWWLVDFIISLVKLSSYPGDDFIFTSDGHFTK